MYSVKEIYYTLQGEGAQAGRPAVFCRFSGCNLWTGKEKDRETAKCYFCDTDFVGTDGILGGKYNVNTLAKSIVATWQGNSGARPFVVFTGGEPLLQLDRQLIERIKKHGFEIAVETNGTIKAPQGIDWLTVSPKPSSELVQKNGNELKLVYPQKLQPEEFQDLEFEHFFLSPMTVSDQKQTDRNTKEAITYCLKHPKWRLTLQYHKYLGIP